MGKIVISGRGKDLQGLGVNWVTAGVCAVLVMIVGFVLAFNNRIIIGIFGTIFAGRANTNVEGSPVLFWIIVFISVMLAGLSLIWVLLRNGIIKETQITVYENGVTGKGVHRDFDNKTLSPEKFISTLQEFSLNFEKISSVETTDNKGVVLNIHGKEHLIFADNNKEIVAAINAKIN